MLNRKEIRIRRHKNQVARSEMKRKVYAVIESFNVLRRIMRRVSRNGLSLSRTIKEATNHIRVFTSEYQKQKELEDQRHERV